MSLLLWKRFRFESRLSKLLGMMKLMESPFSIIVDGTNIVKMLESFASGDNPQGGIEILKLLCKTLSEFKDVWFCFDGSRPRHKHLRLENIKIGCQGFMWSFLESDEFLRSGVHVRYSGENREADDTILQLAARLCFDNGSRKKKVVIISGDLDFVTNPLVMLSNRFVNIHYRPTKTRLMFLRINKEVKTYMEKDVFLNFISSRDKKEFAKERELFVEMMRSRRLKGKFEYHIKRRAEKYKRDLLKTKINDPNFQLDGHRHIHLLRNQDYIIPPVPNYWKANMDIVGPFHKWLMGNVILQLMKETPTKIKPSMCLYLPEFSLEEVRGKMTTNLVGYEIPPEMKQTLKLFKKNSSLTFRRILEEMEKAKSQGTEIGAEKESKLLSLLSPIFTELRKNLEEKKKKKQKKEWWEEEEEEVEEYKIHSWKRKEKREKHENVLKIFDSLVEILVYCYRIIQNNRKHRPKLKVYEFYESYYDDGGYRSEVEKIIGNLLASEKNYNFDLLLKKEEEEESDSSDQNSDFYYTTDSDEDDPTGQEEVVPFHYNDVNDYFSKYESENSCDAPDDVYYFDEDDVPERFKGRARKVATRFQKRERR